MSTLMKHLMIFAAACLLSCAARAIPDQPGTLDATFNGFGKVIAAVGSDADNAVATLVQPDGKIVIAGNCRHGSSIVMCALRLTNAGAPDTSFGTSGKFFAAASAGSDSAAAIAIQRDGKLVLGGYCASGGRLNFCAVRVNSDGTSDSTFGSSGKITPQVGTGFSTATAIAIQTDGKIVLAGRCIGGFCATRHRPDGSLDETFNQTGSVVASPSGSGNAEYAHAVALQAGDKIVIAGECATGNSWKFCALRFTPNGALDTAFNVNGRVVTEIGTFPANNAYGRALAAQPDGKILVGGFCGASNAYYFCALRYRVDGTLDPTFGTAGIVKTTFSGDAQASALLLQPDGKIVMTGTCLVASEYDFCAARHTSEGVLDVTFNTTGKVITAIGSGGDTATAASQQRDGKLVVAGSCSGVSDVDFCAARYDGGPFGYQTCSLDIDGDGRILATTDSLIHARLALGITGDAVVNGIVFPGTAQRTTWPLISDYLLTQCGQ
jgi:uncharacterized delta-60 repeat protein